MNPKIDKPFIIFKRGEVKGEKSLADGLSVLGTSPFCFTTIKKIKFLKMVKYHLDILWAKANRKTLHFENSSDEGKISLNFQNP